MFFEASQTNSGGSWEKPAMKVFVEAADYDEALSIALENGVYFDGVDAGLDCECCGNRWYMSTRPVDYVPCEPDVLYDTWSKQFNVPRELVIRKEAK